jgi:hypothetical protein
MKTTFKITVAISLLFSLISCEQNSFDSPDGSVQGQKINSTTTIGDLKTKYIKSAAQFTADKIVSDQQLVVNGIVTTTDIEGNVYKYIAVQEETPGGQAIRVSIDAAGIASLYPLGQRVSIIVNDLCIGKYGESPQIGVYFVRPKDGQISPGAIPMPIARECVIPYGEATPNAVVADTMTIAQIIAAPREKMDYHLVCIKNAWFTGKGFDYGQPSTIADKDKIFAPGTNGIGFPQSREIRDVTGSAAIATSEFAKFAQYKLPASTYKGNITAVVSWYKKGTSGNYQLTLRTLGDLGKGYEGYLNSVNYKK